MARTQVVWLRCWRVGRLILFTIVCFTTVFGQQPRGNTTSAEHVSTQSTTANGTSASAKGMSGKQMTNIPYFSQQDGMESVLTLNNNTPNDQTIGITIFNTNGKAFQVPAMTIKSGITNLNLAELLGGKSEFDAGNIEIMYDANPMAITCQVGVFIPAARMSFESKEVDMMDFRSSNLNAIVWRPDEASSASLALTNTASMPVSAAISFASGMMKIGLGPRETRVIRLEKEFAAQKWQKQQGEVALLRISHNGTPGAIIATGFVLNSKTGYSSSFGLVDPAVSRSTRLAAAGVRLGYADVTEGLPINTKIRAPLVMANVGTQPLTARVSVDYTFGGTPTSLGVAERRIAPGELTVVELTDEMARLGITGPLEGAGVDIQFRGAGPGSLIAELTSMDQSGDFAFEVPVKDPQEITHMSGSTYPWSLVSGDQTTVYLKNTTAKPTWATVQFRFPGGVYQPKPVQLQAFQTIAIDIETLKESGEKDMRGNLFPQTATSGVVEWIEAKPMTMIGRAEIVNVAAGTARSFSCQTCNCPAQMYGSPYMYPASYTASVGYSGTPFDPEYDSEDCNGIIIYGNSFSSYDILDWTSSNTSVASVTNSGSVSAKAGGSASITADLVWDEYYDAGPYQNPECQYTTYYPSASGTLNVKPTISSISPPKALIGTNVSVTIQGNGLSGASVNAGSGISVTVNSSSSTQVQATFAVSASAAGGNHSVTVTVSGQTSNGVNFYVQIPSGSRIVSTLASYAINSTTTPSCQAGQAGWYRRVHKRVTAQDGSDITQDPQSITETVTITSPNDLQIPSGNVTTGSADTSGGGYFDDILQVCSTLCPASTGQTDATQVIKDVPPNITNQYQLSSNTFKYTCGGNYINGQ